MPLDCGQPTEWKADPTLEDGARRLAASRLKRVVDILGSAGGLLLLAPFLLLVAILVRLESPGPVLFKQHRGGYKGKSFVIYKFRTMVAQEDGPSIVQARRVDCRTTRLGCLLRRTSVDELPNLINVLKGEMSLVGPRPHAIAHDSYWTTVAPGYELRFMARPGLTGLAQVKGYRGEVPNRQSIADRVAWDLEYIRTWSLGLDLKILLRTLLSGPSNPAAY